MYKIIEKPEMMAAKDIDAKYDGKWVYIVNAEFNDMDEFIRGIPVVIGDSPFEGVEEGIYDKYDDEKYGMGYSHTLINNKDFISIIQKI